MPAACPALEFQPCPCAVRAGGAVLARRDCACAGTGIVRVRTTRNAFSCNDLPRLGGTDGAASNDRKD